MPSYKFIPQVNSCFFFIKDLKFATYLISVVSMVQGLSTAQTVFPICTNIYSDDRLGIVLFIVGGLTFSSGILLFTASIVLLVSTWSNKPTVRWFITLSITTCTMLIVYNGMAYAKTKTAGFRSDVKLPGVSLENEERARSAYLAVLLLQGCVGGLLMLYFLMVVNSHVLEYERHAVRRRSSQERHYSLEKGNSNTSQYRIIKMPAPV